MDQNQNKLTSRKLAMGIVGIIALVGLTLIVGFYPATAEFAEKVVLGIGAITLTAIGAQAVLDQIAKG